MKLEELQVDDKIVFQITIENQNFEFETFVALNIQGTPLLNPIRVDNKVVNFSSDKVRADLMFIRPGKSPITWKRVSISTISYNKSSYYVVNCATPGVENNRRSAFRLSVGIKGVAQMGFNRNATDVILKDVSESGFSFVCDKEEEIDGMTVRLVFVDMETNFSLSGLVVRKAVIDDSRVIYGCVLNIKNQLLNRYISQKQREILAKHSTMSSDTKKRNLGSMIAEGRK